MQIRNAYPDHIGLLTLDDNRSHVLWPCISHPASMACEQAQRLASKRGLRSLVPAPSNAQVRPFPAPQQEP